MKISVERIINTEGNLVFTISVSEPHLAGFGDVDKIMMNILDACQNDIFRVTVDENKIKNDVMGLIHAAKEKAFVRVLDNLKFSIENEFRPKFKPICQEIYNWIHDKQTNDLKKWMIEFDPERTKYYFDNDLELKNQKRSYSIPDDKIDDEEKEGDDEE